MSSQIIISVNREYGSGGLDVSRFLSEKLGIELYDKNMDEEIAEAMGIDPKELERFDEKPKKRIATRTVSGYSNSMEDILVEKQDEWLREKADAGESFIVIGRMANKVFSDHPGLIKVFITGDEDYKIQRIMEYLSVDEKTAKEHQIHVDHVRRAYHNRYADHKWGDSRHYDIIVNAGKLGMEETAQLLFDYVQVRIKALEESEVS